MYTLLLNITESNPLSQVQPLSERQTEAIFPLLMPITSERNRGPALAFNNVFEKVCYKGMWNLIRTMEKYAIEEKTISTKCHI